MLSRNGWTRKTLNIGDEITVEGALAKDGSKMANARVVTLAERQARVRRIVRLTPKAAAAAPATGR